MSAEDNDNFINDIRNDLQVIVTELPNMLGEHYDHLRITWRPENEFDFILGWVIGNIESRYPQVYQERFRIVMPQEVFFRVTRVISERRDEIENVIQGFIDSRTN